MRIMKFGGTSVGTPEAIRKLIAIVKSRKQRPVVVVSAFSGVTDQLIAIARAAAKGERDYRVTLNKLTEQHRSAVEELVSGQAQLAVARAVQQILAELIDVAAGIFLVRELTPRTLDFVMSFGERLSATIIVAAFVERGVRAEFTDARELIKTDDAYGVARVNFDATHRLINSWLKKLKAVPVITGFIGSGESGITTTLGRGGSDYTAAIVGAAINAEVIEIWTDVDGVMTADPRKVPEAFVINELSYLEAMEMSYFGAKVIHPPTMVPAMEKNIPLLIKNTFNPNAPGTLIVDKPKPFNYLIRGVTSISNIALLRLEGSGLVGTPGISGRLFSALARTKINIILISQASSEQSICFAVLAEDAEAARMAVHEEFSMEMETGRIAPLVVEGERAIVAVVGANMQKRPGVSAKVFGALGRSSINVIAIAQGSSELNISVVVERGQVGVAVKAMHSAFFSPAGQTSLYLMGSGRVGGSLLNQIKKLTSKKSALIKLSGVINSEKMLLNQNGIKLAGWSKLLKGGLPADADQFISQVIKSDNLNIVLVDCTASPQIAARYAELLSNRVSVVTPNKHANTGTLAYYRKIKKAANQSGASYKYTATVGGGLPILPAIQRLNSAGDKIVSIEAVLSGTLSYIFNNYIGNKKFSAVVKDAWQRGYTEPDPREDLSGRDVGRKLLILARELGYSAEAKDIKAQGLLPAACVKAKTVKDFFAALENFDKQFEKKKQQAKKAGKRLCYIASLAGGKGRVELVAIPTNHPFYGLNGADNIVAIKSVNYNATPLVIRGPGAGPEVTAAGILADIQSINF